MTNGILLTRHNQEIAQWLPDPFPRERVGSGHETTVFHAGTSYLFRQTFRDLTFLFNVLYAGVNWTTVSPSYLGRSSRIESVSSWRIFLTKLGVKRGIAVERIEEHVTEVLNM